MKTYVGQIRSQLGLKRPAFARLLCVSPRTVARWEEGGRVSGAVHMRDLIALESALDADPDLGTRHHQKLAAGQMDLFTLLLHTQEHGSSDETHTA